MAANTCCRSAASASTLMLAPWLAGRARTRLGAIPDLEPLDLSVTVNARPVVVALGAMQGRSKELEGLGLSE